MIEVEARRYSPRQVARWRTRLGSYLDHVAIGEEPHASHRHRLRGDRWLPAGLPDTGFYLAAGNRLGYHTHVPVTATGHGLFGTGVACFTWQELAVLDETGTAVWTGDIDLGMKRNDDVWVVTVAPDPPEA